MPETQPATPPGFIEDAESLEREEATPAGEAEYRFREGVEVVRPVSIGERTVVAAVVITGKQGE
jgi:hypothetical protein